MTLNTTTAFQDQLKGNHCFGCGPDNTGGLRIKSRWLEEDKAVCFFNPEAHHCSAPTHYLNGSIIATVMDCHAVCTAIAKAYSMVDREIDKGEPILFATGNLNLSFLKPTPIDGPIKFIAEVIEAKEKKITLNCEVFSDDDLCAKGELIAVRVPANW